jgi:acyl-CoA thioester hydrolase
VDIETRYPTVIEQEIAWGEQDKLGHVNNVHYFRYFENARIAHFRSVRMSMPEPDEPGCGPILAHTRCDYLKPLVFPDRIRIEAGVSRLGTSSFVHSYRIYSMQQQCYVARGESVNVYFDYASQKSTPLPEELRQAIVAFESGQTAVSAGG